MLSHTATMQHPREEVVLRQPGFIVRQESRGRTSVMQRHDRHGDMSVTNMRNELKFVKIDVVDRKFEFYNF